jgi:uncharacterized damage-inducible protein DinB
MVARLTELARRNTAINIELFGRLNDGATSDQLRASAQRVLEHILFCDRLWVSRIAGEPVQQSATTLPDLRTLWESRKIQDKKIESVFCRPSIADTIVTYSTVGSQSRAEPVWVAGLRMFNHQTNHRWKIEAALDEALSIDSLLHDITVCTSAG